MSSLRHWFIRKLDAVSREAVEEFAADYLTTNGRVPLVITQSGSRHEGLVLVAKKDGPAAVIAPWVQYCVIADCLIAGPFPSEPPK